MGGDGNLYFKAVTLIYTIVELNKKQSSAYSIFDVNSYSTKTILNCLGEQHNTTLGIEDMLEDMKGDIQN